MEHADSEGAVDRADSPSVSPRANEHEDGIEADEAVDGTEEASNYGELGASSLAVDITVLNHIDVVAQQVSVQVLVIPVCIGTVSGFEGSVPSLSEVGVIGFGLAMIILVIAIGSMIVVVPLVSSVSSDIGEIRSLFERIGISKRAFPVLVPRGICGASPPLRSTVAIVFCHCIVRVGVDKVAVNVSLVCLTVSRDSVECQTNLLSILVNPSAPAESFSGWLE